MSPRAKGKRQPQPRIGRIPTRAVPHDRRISRKPTEQEVKLGVQVQYQVDVSVGVDDTISDDSMESIETAVHSRLEEAGQDITDLAAEAVPVKTGRLRDSIYYFVGDDLSLTVGATMPYSAAVEARTPFLCLLSKLSKACFNQTLNRLSKTTLKLRKMIPTQTVLTWRFLGDWKVE